MDIDQAFQVVGDYGKLQRRVFWSMAIPQIFLAWNHMLNVFVGATPLFHCIINSSGKDSSESTPEIQKGCSSDPLNSPCDKYSFDDDEFTSIASEWDLVCESAYKTDLAQSIFMAGLLTGNFMGGYMADTYGRKPVCYIGVLGLLFFGCFSVVAPSFDYYLVLRLAAGISAGSYGLVSFTMPAEMVGAAHRGYVNVVTSIAFALGISSLPILAFVIRDWHLLTLIAVMPGLVGIYYYYYIPESPRWLLSQGRVEEAEETMLGIWEVNKPSHLHHHHHHPTPYISTSSSSPKPSQPSSSSSSTLSSSLLLKPSLKSPVVISDITPMTPLPTTSAELLSQFIHDNILISETKLDNGGDDDDDGDNDDVSGNDDAAVVRGDGGDDGDDVDSSLHHHHHHHRYHHRYHNLGKRRKITLKSINQSNRKVSQSIGWLDMIRSRKLVCITANNMFTWFVSNILYYGLTLKMGDFDGNKYVNVAIAGLVEIPASLLTLFLMDRYGRRLTYTHSLSLCSISAFIITFLGSDGSLLSTLLALVGKACVSVTVCVSWMHAAEMYPTNIRNKALSLCCMSGRFGGVVAPLILTLGRSHQGLDFLIFAITSLMAAVISRKLPETLHRSLPETIDDLD